MEGEARKKKEGGGNQGGKGLNLPTKLPSARHSQNKELNE